MGSAIPLQVIGVDEDRDERERLRLLRCSALREAWHRKGGGSWAWPFCLGRRLWLCGLGLASLLGLLSLLGAALILLSWGVVAPLACSCPLGSLAECREVLPWPERPTSLSLLASPDLAVQCLSNASTLPACPSKHGLQWT